jgi:ribosomal protein S21
MQAAVRVEVKRGKNESSASLIRRFTRRAQGLNIVRSLRGQRFFVRQKSKNVGHARALVKHARKVAYATDVKLGKIDPTKLSRGKKK